jgi:hypothetical protein
MIGTGSCNSRYFGSEKMNVKQITLGMVFIASTNLAYADTFQPSPVCYKPRKPYQFNSRMEIDDFYAQVDRYKRCVMDFIEEQKQAIQVHQSAVDEAVNEWNRYVKSELK